MSSASTDEISLATSLFDNLFLLSLEYLMDYYIDSLVVKEKVSIT